MTGPSEMSSPPRGSRRSTNGTLQLDRIQEGTEYTSSRSAMPSSRDTKPPTVQWPFHNRTNSEVASSPRSSRIGNLFHNRNPSGVPSTLGSGSWFGSTNRLGMLRPSNWQPRSFFRTQDDAVSIDRSIVPDYIVNFMRGETPETLARKREQRKWGERGVEIRSRRDTLTSHLVEYGQFYSSSTELTGGMNGCSNSSARSGLRRHFTGWRGGVVFNTLLAFIILVVGIICLILVITRTKLISGESAIYSGDCNTANNINIGIHVVINVLTIAILSGANHVFQVLSSPTKHEVSIAHENKWWLDIGVPSLRNLIHISGFRVTLGAVILLIAVTTQVIYNAIIFTTRNPEKTCSVIVSGSMLGAVALLNLGSVISMAIILTRSTFEPLATLGDALRYFSRNPDPTTTDACLMTKADVRQGRWGLEEAKFYKPSSHYWIQTPSISHWASVVLSWLAIGAPTAVAVALLIIANPDDPFTPFGTATPSPATTFLLPTPIEAAQMALLAALPQLLLAVLYLIINSLLTTYFLSHEFSLFALAPRPLRVSSNPAGHQISSLYLTLPRPVSWVLLVVFAGLGFLLSQAVFSTVARDMIARRATTTVAIAFGTRALIALLSLLTALLLGVLALGLRRAPAARLATGDAAGNPLVLRGGSCSAVISARCGGNGGLGAEARSEMALAPLAWGVVDEGMGVGPGIRSIGHCAFAPNGLGLGCMDVGRSYA
ncbi:hypothetical protein F5X99DRAFT_185420 [Biscogniauxia marginata]|nr:hypothetical protein F5X99DRAFT_185420 [Biscogniauxia marginata]